MKTCKKCGIEKKLCQFYIYKSSGNARGECKLCQNEYQKAWLVNNVEAIRKINKKHYNKNKDEIISKRKKYYKENPDKQIERNGKYRAKYKDCIKKKRRVEVARRRKCDPSFKLKSNVSRAIRYMLKKHGGGKFGKSIRDFLGYSIDDLREYLESQFAYWMTWENYGGYIQNWDDDDPSTWTWQIDHIIPQSKLPYDSMEHSNFKLCWSLLNLRPLDTKTNFLDGINRVRH